MPMIRSAVVLCAAVSASAKVLAPTPPMGWMNWEIFRCETDCATHPDSCVNQQLFMGQTDKLVSEGYRAVGYNTIHMDDCWMQTKPPRDAQGKLQPNPERFPSGMKALGDYMHERNVSFGCYTAESPHTCAGYPASAGHEVTDAKTFAEWGVDYLKVDGCGDASYYPTGYPKMGDALLNSGRDIVFSCSWPAYLGSNETAKPWAAIMAAHCNLWRNWDDIQCNWGSLSSIIAHWGKYTDILQKVGGTGHWNDPDMLLIGNTCITADEARTQMAIWSVVAGPLIMGNDLRKVPAEHKEILLNKEAVAVNQDPAGVVGGRVSVLSNQGEVWVRKLSSGHALALYNPTDASLEIEVDFSKVGLSSTLAVRDIWAHKDLGRFSTFKTTVPAHGTGFFTLA